PARRRGFPSAPRERWSVVAFPWPLQIDPMRRPAESEIDISAMSDVQDSDHTTRIVNLVDHPKESPLHSRLSPHHRPGHTRVPLAPRAARDTGERRGARQSASPLRPLRIAQFHWPSRLSAELGRPPDLPWLHTLSIDDSAGRNASGEPRRRNPPNRPQKGRRIDRPQQVVEQHPPPRGQSL